MVERYKLPFDILSDPEAKMVRAYGVVHEGGHPFGKGDIALPSHFLINTNGKVTWSFIATHPKERPRHEAILAALAALKT